MSLEAYDTVSDSKLTGNKMKPTVILNKITDFSEFAHRWKHLGYCEHTTQKIYYKDRVF